MKFKLLLFVVLAVSCKPKENKCSFVDKNIRNIRKLKGLPCNNDSLELLKPNEIIYHPDSFLIVRESKTKYFLKIVDLKNNKVQELVKRGKGPNELISITSMHLLNSSIYVYGYYRKTLLRIDLKDKVFNMSNNIKMREHPYIVKPINDDLFVGFNQLSKDKRLSLINRNGEVIKNIGELPMQRNGKRSNNDLYDAVLT